MNRGNLKAGLSGFTIVELLVVIVVIGVLAAISIVSYTGIAARANVSSLQSDLDNASKLLKLDQVLLMGYPASLSVANGGKGVVPSPSTTFRYAYNNNVSPQTFCVAATRGGVTYKITDDGSSAVGDCQNYGTVTRLNAGDTASYPSPFTGTVWTDLSNNANHGTLTNGVGYSAADGGQLTFDGINDYVLTGTTNRPTNTFSFGGWIKTSITHEIDAESTASVSGTSGQKYAFEPHNQATDCGAGLSIGTNGISVYEHGNSYLPSTLVYSSAIGSNWNYVVVSYYNKQPTLYVNGVIARIGLTSPKTTVYAPYMIGGHTSYGFMNGSIGELFIRNRVMSADEILQNFDDQKGRYGL